jgi:serine/threonine-protein kinase RsbW
MPTMKFSGTYESLPAISDFVRQIAGEAGLNEDDVYAVELAVDEACTNIIEHAYAKQKSGEIVCSCEAMSDGLEIVLMDQGKKFSPEGIPEPDPTLPLEQISARGAGLYLMRKMMDEIDFDYDPQQGNKLRMVKRKSSAK